MARSSLHSSAGKEASNGVAGKYTAGSVDSYSRLTKQEPKKNTDWVKINVLTFPVYLEISRAKNYQ